MSNTKRCTGPCGRERPLSEFYWSPTTKDGYWGKCKECHKEYYRVNRDKLIQAGKDYYQQHKEKKKQYAREQYADKKRRDNGNHDRDN